MRIDDIRCDSELADEARLFFGDELPLISLEKTISGFTVSVGDIRYDIPYGGELDEYIPEEHREKRLNKIIVYRALEKHTGKTMPWGALTGVRPTKLFYECLRNNRDASAARRIMEYVYGVSEGRAKLLEDIIGAQRGRVFYPEGFINLYVHIPYCTTRCSYCSFVSMPIEKCREQSKEYVKLLCDEIKASVDFLARAGKTVLSVYIGGGTPTALGERELDDVLAAIGNFDCEYTCEAGRPDTITRAKLDILKSHGVTRVCVNPQTLNNDTLIKIGRSHTVDDFFAAYDMCKAMNFDINCDLIAGLEDETLEDFKVSFDGIKSLIPENITVHSLSKKNGSGIRYSDGVNFSAPEMTEYALNHLDGYTPYYLYRQKRQAGNLENVGFCKAGKQCVNNITTMEETVGVMACGAGAISKSINGGNIARLANMRDVGLYILRFEERLKYKLEFFEQSIQK